MNTQDLRTKTIAELQDELKSLLAKQFKLRMNKGMGESPKTHLFKEARRAIARVKTIIAEKECEL